eukprot:jgi/Psemu1/37674/gm1.37674_g
MGRLILGPPSVKKLGVDVLVDAPKTTRLLADNLDGQGPNRRTGSGRRRGVYRSGRDRVGCWGHLLVLLLPILAMAFTLAFLVVLLVYDRSELQMVEFYGDEEFREIAGIYFGTIRSDTISFVMSQYEPYSEVVALATIAALLNSVVTIARNIQIEVYHRRNESVIFMKFVNYLASLANILAYVGLLVAVSFRLNQDDPSWAVVAHYYGAMIFFAGTVVYAVLHWFLLWNQSQYPTAIGSIFGVLALVIAVSSILFVLPIWKDGGGDDDGDDDGGWSEEGTQPVLEWVSVFATSINIGLLSVLFHIDPVDDELQDFFCGGRTARRRQQQQQARNGMPFQAKTLVAEFFGLDHPNQTSWIVDGIDRNDVRASPDRVASSATTRPKRRKERTTAQHSTAKHSTARRGAIDVDDDTLTLMLMLMSTSIPLRRTNQPINQTHKSIYFIRLLNILLRMYRVPPLRCHAYYGYKHPHPHPQPFHTGTPHHAYLPWPKYSTSKYPRSTTQNHTRNTCFTTLTDRQTMNTIQPRGVPMAGFWLGSKAVEPKNCGVGAQPSQLLTQCAPRNQLGAAPFRSSMTRLFLGKGVMHAKSSRSMLIVTNNLSNFTRMTIKEQKNGFKILLRRLKIRVTDNHESDSSEKALEDLALVELEKTAKTAQKKASPQKTPHCDISLLHVLFSDKFASEFATKKNQQQLASSGNGHFWDSAREAFLGKSSYSSLEEHSHPFFDSTDLSEVIPHSKSKLQNMWKNLNTCYKADLMNFTQSGTHIIDFVEGESVGKVDASDEDDDFEKSITWPAVLYLCFCMKEQPDLIHFVEAQVPDGCSYDSMESKLLSTSSSSSSGSSVPSSV